MKLGASALHVELAPCKPLPHDHVRVKRVVAWVKRVGQRHPTHARVQQFAQVCCLVATLELDVWGAWPRCQSDGWRCLRVDAITQNLETRMPSHRR